ncbi:helix-turn-helix domain-containing protein [Syntrophomonas curvata]
MKHEPKLRELIAKAKSGDAEATVQVVDRFAPLVRKHSHWLGYDEATSDLTIWIIEAIHRYPAERHARKR